MIKRILSLFLIMVMSVLLTACSEEKVVYPVDVVKTGNTEEIEETLEEEQEDTDKQEE